jgi:hypothetical protein
MRANFISYRVRVRRAVEDWVTVEAESPLQAEEKAATIPGVLSVFGKSALRGDRPVVDAYTTRGIEDNDGL